MTLTRKQAAASITTPVLGVAPTQGNLLVIFAAHRSDAATSFGGVSNVGDITAEGYTLAVFKNLYSGNSTTRRGTAVLYKIAGPSESATMPVYDFNPAYPKMAYFAEFESSDPSFDWDLLHAAFDDSGGVMNATALSVSSEEFLPQHPDVLGISLLNGRDLTPAGSVWNSPFNDFIANSGNAIGLAINNGQFIDEIITSNITSIPVNSGLSSTLLLFVDKLEAVATIAGTYKTVKARNHFKGTISSNNHVGGTLYAVLTGSASVPTTAQIKAGQDHTGTIVSAVTVSAMAFGNEVSFSGLTANTEYHLHVVQENSYGFSNIVSYSFTTSIFSRRQYKAIAHTNTNTLTMDSVPVEGNLLVLSMTHRTEPRSTFAGLTTVGQVTAEGWKLVVLLNYNAGLPNSRCGLAIMTKVAGTSEPTTLPSYTWEAEEVGGDILVQEFDSAIAFDFSSAETIISGQTGTVPGHIRFETGLIENVLTNRNLVLVFAHDRGSNIAGGGFSDGFHDYLPSPGTAVQATGFAEKDAGSYKTEFRNNLPMEVIGTSLLMFEGFGSGDALTDVQPRTFAPGATGIVTTGTGFGV